MKKIVPEAERRSSRREKPTFLTVHSDKNIEPVTAAKLEKLTDLTRRRGRERIARSSRDTYGAKPVCSSEPLIAYRYDPNLARSERVAKQLRRRYSCTKTTAKKNKSKAKSPDVFGREVARSYVYGFVAAFPLSHDRLNWTLAESDWVFSALEPYAIDVWGNKMGLAGANYVWLIDMESGEVRSCQIPRLSQSHTVQFSHDGKRLLVVSSGFDAVIEFDTESGEVAWQWFAWGHDYAQSKLGHYVVRSPQKSELLKAMGKEVLLVNDPSKFEFGVPTRLSPRSPQQRALRC